MAHISREKGQKLIAVSNGEGRRVCGRLRSRWCRLNKTSAAGVIYNSRPRARHSTHSPKSTP